MFECRFVVDGVRCEYGFVANDDAFVEEWLFAWPRGRKQVWFERDRQAFKFGEHLRGENHAVEKFTRTNSLFLSAAAQHQHEQLMPVYRWFARARVMDGPERRVRSLNATRLRHAVRVGRQASFFSDPDDAIGPLMDAVLALLKVADIGITDIRLDKDFEEPPPWASQPPTGQFWLRHRSSSGEAWLPLVEESSGTKAIFRLATDLVSALRFGGLMVVDELKSNLHPALGAHLIRQFQDVQTNRNNAQLIFTTHDTNLLGTSMGKPELRRDQVWLCEKDDEGATSLYPLTDFKPRKAENIETGYLQGRYGAVPFLGELALFGEE